MRKFYTFALLALVALAGCEGPRVTKLEERMVALENEVTELKQQVSSGGAGAESPELQRAKAMEALKNLAEKMEEQTFSADSSLKAGMGGVELMVVPREETQESRENFMLALRDPTSADLKIHGGVEVMMGDKSYGKTPAKGTLRIVDLAPGEYEFKLSASGFEVRTYPFEVREGQIKKIVTFLLKPGEMNDARQGLQNFINQVSGQQQPGEQ